MSYTWNYKFSTADVGWGLQITHDRLMFEPWVGAHFARGDESFEYTSDIPGDDRSGDEKIRPHMLITSGLLISADITTGESHRLAAFLEVQISSRDDDLAVANTYNGATFGLAYRH